MQQNCVTKYGRKHLLNKKTNKLFNEGSQRIYRNTVASKLFAPIDICTLTLAVMIIALGESELT